MQKKQGSRVGVFRAGASGRVGVAHRMGAGSGGSCAGAREYFVFQEVTKMKVVLIDNPKFFAGLLRMMFGIKKENRNFS